MTRRRVLAAFAAAAGFAIPAIAFAADGDPDKTFGTNGILAVALGPDGTPVFMDRPVTALAPNGDIVIALRLSPPSSDPGVRIMRRTSAGALTGYGDPHGPGEADDGVFVPFASDVRDVRVLASGAIVVIAGSTVIRTDANGDSVTEAPFPTPSGCVNASMRDARVRPDGGLVVGWACDDEHRVQRVGANDAEAGNTMIVKGFDIRRMALAPSGRIFVSENVFSPPARVVALSPAGVIDDTYGTSGMGELPGQIGKLVADDEDRLIASHESGPSGTWRFTRLDAAGDPDSSFDNDGEVAHVLSGVGYGAGELAVQPDEKLLATGYLSNDNGSALVRLNENGSLDTSFSDDGLETFESECPEFNSAGPPIAYADGRILWVLAGSVGEDGNCDDPVPGRRIAYTGSKAPTLAAVRFGDAPPVTTTTTTTTQTTTTATTPQPQPQPAPFVPPVASKSCVSRRAFSIRLRTGRRKRDESAIVSADVRVNGKKVTVTRGERHRSRVNLRNLPKGRFSVTIRLRLADGGTVRETRRYRTCREKIEHELAPLRTFPPKKKRKR